MSICDIIMQVIVMIPRQDCESMSVLCMEVQPGVGSGWTDTDDYSNVHCVDISAMLNCDGKADHLPLTA